MYDRRTDPAEESLWSQLRARAVCGPAAAADRSLTVLHASLVSWSAWLAHAPDTTVITPDPAMAKRYKQTSYARYFHDGVVSFPIDPPVPPGELAAMDRLVIVAAGGQRRAYPLSYIAARADADGVWRDRLAGIPLRFQYQAKPESALVTAEGDSRTSLAVHYSLWFAWHAMRDSADLLAGE